MAAGEETLECRSLSVCSPLPSVRHSDRARKQPAHLTRSRLWLAAAAVAVSQAPPGTYLTACSNCSSWLPKPNRTSSGALPTQSAGPDRTGPDQKSQATQRAKIFHFRRDFDRIEAPGTPFILGEIWTNPTDWLRTGTSCAYLTLTALWQRPERWASDWTVVTEPHLIGCRCHLYTCHVVMSLLELLAFKLRNKRNGLPKVGSLSEPMEGTMCATQQTPSERTER